MPSTLCVRALRDSSNTFSQNYTSERRVSIPEDNFSNSTDIEHQDDCKLHDERTMNEVKVHV
jgi:hypothetical protein